nr:ATP-dependent RNA helicase HrpA [Psittacicella gerlachiana]
MRADETFGLSTVNPYASDNEAGSAFARRIYSEKSPTSQDLESAKAREVASEASQVRQQTNLDAVPAKLNAETSSSSSTHSSQEELNSCQLRQEQQQEDTFTPQSFTQYKLGPHGFGSSDKDLKAYKNYRKFADDADSSLELGQGIIAACEELFQEGRGDILVFLSGEREIRDVANELSQHFTHVNRRFPGLKILPLYSRLSSSEQQLIFKPDGSLRIILATNIAETSLTVPGIKYVIDAGTARISRYNYKTQVQGLPIEAISQASANQRKGRCGRTSPGICIRLYSEEDFNSRPEFTDPEIKRTNLSAVILKMLSLNLPHIEDFPFLDAPERSFIRSGLRLLEQLEAIQVTEHGYRINKLGKQLAELPVDPRLGRMILEASHLGSLNELLILASGMTIVDVRERPQGKAEHAQQLHAEYKDKNSDYMTLLNLWNFIFAEKMSNTQFRKFCKRRYLNYLRIREWQDLYSQLKLVALQLKLKLNQLPANYPEIHRAMIPGLLDHIAQIDSADKLLYRGARGKTFRFFNTSVLHKQRKTWVMVSEMLHLNQTYAMMGANIEPSWVEPYARHLLKYAYQQPHWSKRRGEVCAYMSANLFGLTIVDKRLVSYGKIDPEVSRQIFIRQALVEQNWDQEYEFYLHNNTLLAQALKVEEQQRKRGIIISEEDLYQWYAQRIPQHINNNVSFARWWNQQEQQDPHYLDINLEQILNPEQELTSFPEYIQDQNWQLKLNYLFEPESKWDGVNVLIPIQFLQGLDYRLYQWHIANYRQELVENLIRNLPKNLRKQLIPAPDYARVFCERIPHVLEEKGKVFSFYQVLAQTFKQINGSYIEAAIWQEATQSLPAHLQVHFKVLDLEGQVIAQSNDLVQLQQDLQQRSQELVNTKSKQDLAKAKIYTNFDFQSFGQMRQLKKGGVLLDSYPALVPVLSLEPEKQQLLSSKLKAIEEQLGNSDLRQNHIAGGVIIQNLATASEQERVMHAGLRDLLLLNSHNPIKFLQEKLPNKAKLAMYFSGSVSKIIAECIRSAADHIIYSYQEQAQAYSISKGNTAQPFIWDKNYYEFLLDKMRSDINASTYKVAQLVEQILILANQIQKELKKPKDLEVMLAVNDIKQQLASLTREDFVAEHDFEQLSQVPRYLEGILYRLARMGQNPSLDQKRQEEVNSWEEVYQQLAQTWPVYRDPTPLKELFFMLQEFRISLFAQTLGSKIPVSGKRIEQFIEQIKENVI